MFLYSHYNPMRFPFASSKFQSPRPDILHVPNAGIVGPLVMSHQLFHEPCLVSP